MRPPVGLYDLIGKYRPTTILYIVYISIYLYMNIHSYINNVEFYNSVDLTGLHFVNLLVNSVK